MEFICFFRFIHSHLYAILSEHRHSFSIGTVSPKMYKNIEYRKYFVNNLRSYHETKYFF